MNISRKYFVSAYNQSIRAQPEDLVPEIDLATVCPRHHLHCFQHPHVFHSFSQRVLQTSGGKCRGQYLVTHMFSLDFADHAAGATDSDPDGPYRLSLYHARSRRGEVHLCQVVK